MGFRVERGANSGDYFFWDGVHQMTELFGGVGTVLTNKFSMSPITVPVADFDNLQDYLRARDIVFAQQIANAVNGETQPSSAQLQAAIESALAG